MNEKIITINAIIQKKKGLTQLPTPIAVRIFCKDQYAVATFSDPKLAKKLYEADAQNGKDVRYDSKLNVMVERFKNKNAKEVATIVGQQMKKAGGTLQ